MKVVQGRVALMLFAASTLLQEPADRSQVRFLAHECADQSQLLPSRPTVPRDGGRPDGEVP
jgi:hypothetical protein